MKKIEQLITFLKNFNIWEIVLRILQQQSSKTLHPSTPSHGLVQVVYFQDSADSSKTT